jgi:hypothetical protein
MAATAASELSAALVALSKQMGALPQATKFSDTWGIQGIPLDKQDLEYMAKILAEKIDSVTWNSSEHEEYVFSDLKGKVLVLSSTIAPHLYSQPNAAASVVSALYSIDLQIMAQVQPSQINIPLTLSSSLQRHIKLATARIQGAMDSANGIEEKIKSINGAYDAAEKLPLTQDDISQALKEIEAAKLASAKLDVEARVAFNVAEGLKRRLEAAALEADAVLIKIESTYRAATSQGLAQAFFDRAKSLNNSMLIWVLLLLGALLSAGLLAYVRFPDILLALSTHPEWGVLFVRLFLGIASVAPPIWVAWIATKQIGQRFRLAEDYSYKAALATAYEGYRSEAAKLDPLFEAQLFATALGRLDEIPLRLVEPNIPGSPWHELLTSAEVKEAMERVPGFRDRFISFMRRDRKGASNASASSGGDGAQTSPTQAGQA